MIDVGSADGFPEGSVEIVRVESHEIGIVRTNGVFYAIRNICPHQFGPVCEGLLRPLLVGADGRAGDLRCDRGRPVITCPWHGWEFFVDSGSAVWNEDYRVRTYPVTVVDGRVYVSLSPARASTAAA
jgi:nitrite reductase/ring-hydroxylating ferredoxin subunit